MEQGGRNRWQLFAKAASSKPAQTSQAATVGNPQQRFTTAMVRRGSTATSPEERTSNAHEFIVPTS